MRFKYIFVTVLNLLLDFSTHFSIAVVTVTGWSYSQVDSLGLVKEHTCESVRVFPKRTDM